MQLTPEQIKKVAREYERTMSASQLADEFGKTISQIRNVACRLRKWGVDVPRAQSSSKYRVIVQELKKSDPKLFIK